MYQTVLLALLTSMVGDPVPATGAAVGVVCEVMTASTPLPAVVEESSGLVRSALDPELFWTHNDSGDDPILYGIDPGGALVTTVAVTGAGAVDWEDIEAAPCDEGHCLYIADIGDNAAERDHVTIYRIPEPARRDTVSAPAEAFHFRFPGGPRDAEGLFMAGDGQLHMVNKGRQEEIALYRIPRPLRAGKTVTLERVRDLFPEPQDTDDRVTAATATPDGRWVGIRTYRTLYIYRADALVEGAAVGPAVVDLTHLDEAQGEGLAMADDGRVWLSSEASGDVELPRWSSLRCTFDS
jgi:hypothetical protein